MEAFSMIGSTVSRDRILDNFHESKKKRYLSHLRWRSPRPIKILLSSCSLVRIIEQLEIIKRPAGLWTFKVSLREKPYGPGTLEGDQTDLQLGS
jgi:hypothetical protein